MLKASNVALWTKQNQNRVVIWKLKVSTRLLSFSSNVHNTLNTYVELTLTKRYPTKIHHTADLFLVCICDVTSPTPYIGCSQVELVKTVLSWCFLNPWAVVQGQLSLFPTLFSPFSLLPWSIPLYKHIPSFSYTVCMISSNINTHIKMIVLRKPRAVTSTRVSVA